jgi:hypothetical protein
MIKTKYISTTNKTYTDYVNSHNRTDRLSTFLKIYTFEKFNEKLVLESFDKKYDDTKFEIESFRFDSSHSNYDKSGHKIWFKTESGNKYRIDLSPLKNFNSHINNDFVWNISFTLDKYNVDDVEYEDLTSLNEEKEVLVRVGNILDRIDIPKYFIIGDTELQKRIRIYKHIVSIVFPNYNIDMNYCEGLFNNKGLYIWK